MAKPTQEQLEKWRPTFEERVFNRYFISHVNSNLTLRDGEKMLYLHELCERDEQGNYVREDVSAMWFGSILHMEYGT